jgi:septum site-determining protein MinC
LPLLKPENSDKLIKPAAFRLKGGLFPLTLLEISHFQAEDFAEQLRAKSAEAPGFFKQTPVVLSFEAFEENLATLPLANIVQICRDQGLLPVALRNDSEILKQLAEGLSLAIMPLSRVKSAPEARADTAPEPSPAQQPDISSSPTKIITSPIRSGQQVYAPGGDLIIMSSVSAGAEVLADGNIHVYGALRGRALAGVLGDTSARIFCQSLEAELVSIAGTFKVDEDLRQEHWKTAIQASLNEQSLCISPLI